MRKYFNQKRAIKQSTEDELIADKSKESKSIILIDKTDFYNIAFKEIEINDQ
ncbi:hypothetical protein [Facklamia sp. P12955]|uniref:hypothetical protein n=1 Tax=unclassified Facklamia TaxID=2622293 RepID=UPI003D17E062